MSPHTIRIGMAVVLMLGVLLSSPSRLRTASVLQHDTGGSLDGVAVPPVVVQVSPYPTVTVRGASSDQRTRLAAALTRFSRAGLDLPDLEVRFLGETNACGGRKGRFAATTTPWRISICSEAGFVYEHELAHAWERAALDDGRRAGFMALGDYEVWSDHSVPWAERGVEGAAFTIQQGLSGPPLPPKLSDEHLARLEAFEYLTGRPDPRLHAWLIDAWERATAGRPAGGVRLHIAVRSRPPS